VNELEGQCALAIQYTKIDLHNRDVIFAASTDAKDPLCFTNSSKRICDYIRLHNGNGFYLQTHFPDDGEACKKDALISAINKGVGIVNYRGHGSEYSWCVPYDVDNDDFKTALSVSHTPHILSIACLTAAVGCAKPPCFGATWIKSFQAVSFLGASAVSYRLINDEFDQNLWYALCEKGVSEIGGAYLQATVKLLRDADPKIDENSKLAHNIRAYLMLGDGTTVL
jgi:hypothetical protein